MESRPLRHATSPTAEITHFPSHCLESFGAVIRPRSINRAKLRIEELEHALSDPDSLRAQVFMGIKRLLEIRTRHTAFSPTVPQQIHRLHPAVFAVERHNTTTGDHVLAMHNVSEDAVEVETGDLLRGEARNMHDARRVAAPVVRLEPYEICWLDLACVPAAAEA